MQKLIFGYTWEQIQNAQQGKALGQTLPAIVDKAGKDDICSRDDLDLFEKHGESGLKEKQFFGVIDRLTQAGVISE